MELTKNKFRKEEVELIVNKINLYYNNKLTDCYAIINDLKEENRKLRVKVAEYKSENDVIASSIKLATKKTKEVSSLIDKKCQAEILSLNEFHNKWKNYFEYLFQKYPLYPEIKELKNLTTKINSILDSAISDGEKVQELTSTFNNSKNGSFNPKKAIQDYVAVTSDNGFNLDDVLNPGELKLEDLCKELGLME